ncbi:hypothetical protein [Bradyrhizobium sp. SZCCHNR3003]|uniref:hypothetical protein n=1 Tax=Bradyrhizobium sp. SZCCHNR3003 TaxID=3057387 RepID=UPI0029165FDC|nr:hypothetical protein [Bradyrhizobium sp. SZCCHNR3003]
MKFRIPELFLGALLAVAIFSIGVLFALPVSVKVPTNEIAQSLWVPSDSVGLYTMVLAVFTALLVVVSAAQGYFILQSDKTAKAAAEAARKSADAATQSADAAYAAERARFFIVIDKHNLTEVLKHVTDRGGLAPGENFYIRFHFVNYGKTPGIIKELTIDSRIAPDPVDPLSHPLIPKQFPARMVGTNEGTEPDGYSPKSLKQSEVQAIALNRDRLWFWGRLYYDDVFGNHHVHKFFYRSEAFANGECILRPFDYKGHNQST